MDLEFPFTMKLEKKKYICKYCGHTFMFWSNSQEGPQREKLF